MLINQFTLIDAFNQFWKACEDGDRRALSCAGLTYFYLCKVWNATGRSISFRRQNTIICAELFISKPTLEKHRNILKQSGLIDFFSKGKGDPNIVYRILEMRVETEEVKKEKNFTTSFTSPFTSDDAYKQSTEKELFIEVEGEVKNFYYLRDLFEADVGLKMNYAQKGLPAGKFSDALETWMMQNNGVKYHDFAKARKHFLFWMPNYQFKNETNNGFKSPSTIKKTVAKSRTTDNDYAGGL